MSLAAASSALDAASVAQDGFAVGLLAWTPLLDPWPGAHDWWWLTAVPLALGISMVYKAYRLADLRRYWPSVMMMTAQIIAAMIAFSLTLFAIALWLLPRLPAE